MVRMFAKTIIDSDAFLDMPSTTQNLYFHLSMRADDDLLITLNQLCELLGAKMMISSIRSKKVYHPIR